MNVQNKVKKEQIKWKWATYFVFYPFPHSRFYSSIISGSNSNFKILTQYCFLLQLRFFHTTTPVLSDPIQSLRELPTQLKNVSPLDHFQGFVVLSVEIGLFSVQYFPHTLDYHHSQNSNSKLFQTPFFLGPVKTTKLISSLLFTR